jgi:hypothetical protein
MLERVEHWAQPRVIGVLAAVTLVLMVSLHVLGGPLTMADCCPRGIVSLELARGGDIDRVLSGWRAADLIPRACRNVWLDFAFIPAYAAFLALLALALRRKLRPRTPSQNRAAKSWRETLRAWRDRLLALLALAFLLAGLLDVVENVLLLRLLGGAAGPSSYLFAATKFTLLCSGLGLLVLGGVSLALRAQRNFPLLQYLFFCRYPLLLGALLVLLGPLCVLALSELLRNLFALKPAQLCWVAFLALLCAGAALLSLRNMLRYAKVRFSTKAPAPERLTAWIRDHWWLVIGGLATPVIVTALFISNAGLSHYGMALLGIVLALLFYWVTALVQELFGDPNRLDSETLLHGVGPGRALMRRLNIDLGAVAEHSRFLRRLSDWIERNFPGYIEGGKVLPGHLQAVLFMALALVAYVIGYFWLDPAGGNTSAVPALGYVLLILLIFTWLLPGLSFFLDRYRVPVVLVLVAVPTLLNLWSQADHYFPITSEKHSGAPVLASFNARDQYSRTSLHAVAPGAGEPPIVVVAASGGGITASLWAATVLTGLQRDLGDAFTDSVHLISTASGGSAGALFYLDQLSAKGTMSEEAMAATLDHAGATSIHGSAWGLAYPDLLRAFAPGLVRRFIGEDRDRGWALEQVWRDHLAEPDRGLADWSPLVAKGMLPAVVFNATQVETGSHFLLSSLQIDKWKPWGSRGHFESYGGRDVPAATAARLSASFPWVTPISRPKPTSNDEEDEDGTAVLSDEALQLRLHLADGGYYDNFGVVSILHWLEQVLGAPGQALRGRRVVVILIRASTYDEEDPTAGSTSEQDGWIYSTVGPVLTLLNVRNTTQFTRNKKELELLAHRWCAESGVGIASYDFQLDREGPLSWKLTDDEYCRIVCSWHDTINLESRRWLLTQFGQAAGAEPDASWLPERCRVQNRSTRQICEKLSPPDPRKPRPEPTPSCPPPAPAPTATALPAAP